MTKLQPGTRWRSVNSTTEVVVTMGDEGTLTCGGRPMQPAGDEARPEPSGRPPTDDVQTVLGKRYRSPDGTLQVLCVRQGAGTIGIDGSPLEMVKPRLLPASD
jgi:hypothetical protein